MDIAINPKLLTDFRLGYYRYNVIDSKYSSAAIADTWASPGINSGPVSHFTAGAPGFVSQLPVHAATNRRSAPAWTSTAATAR